ncbi:proline-rich transmembrane protein 3 [Arapaima gigas]
MALLALFLLLASVQPTYSQVLTNASSSRKLSTASPVGSVHSSHHASSYSPTLPSTEGQTGVSAEGDTQELARVGGHHLALESGNGDNGGESGEGQYGIPTGVYKRKDDPSTHVQRQIQEKDEVTVGVSADSPSEVIVQIPSSTHLASRSLTSAAPATLPPKSTSSRTVQTHTGSGDKARPPLSPSTKDPMQTQETSAQGPVISATNRSSQEAHSSDTTVATEKSVTPARVVEERLRTTEGAERLTAGSGDWLFSTDSGAAEMSTGSLTTKGAMPLNFPIQDQTTTISTTTTKVPAGPSGTLSWSTVASPTRRSSPTPDFQAVYTPTAGVKIKQPRVSGVGWENGTTRVPATTRHTVTESRIRAAGGTTSTTHLPTNTGLTFRTSSSPPLQTGRELGPKAGRAVEKNVSVFVGHAPSHKPDPTPTILPVDPCVSGKGPCSAPTPANSTQLLWGDLRRTLAFAWELHVYGTAVLFLLLAAGALLGLLLAPGLHCPHRGCLGTSNAFLALAGTLRAILFFLDPYGARELLPHTGVAALYNLPLPLLLWAQASQMVLVLRVADLRLIPHSLQRLPLVGVLTVLNCTVVLAADLLSGALSPAVPTVLQTLTLAWGLVLCLGFLLYALPRLQQPPAAHLEEPVPRAEVRSSRVLGRVLAVCACLGVLCCGLHIHATLWLCGWLGPWRSFSWAWWLVQFWARLLELAWASFMLLVASWVFWRPRGRHPGLAEGVSGADLPSQSSSSASSQSHPCWAKIMQSLRGRPCGKSESNGVGEVPNNWASQERPGADISKSLIRNRDQPPGLRSLKDSNRGRNQKGGGSAGSLLRLQSLGHPPQRSLSSSLDHQKEWACEKESVISLNDFDLRPPSPIDLSRSIDEALHREHLLRGGIFFRTWSPPSPTSPALHRHPVSSWPRRSSDPQINLSESCDQQDEQDGRTESVGTPGGGTTKKQTTAPATPMHHNYELVPEHDLDCSAGFPTSISCPVSLRAYRPAVQLRIPLGDDTKPFLTPDSEPNGTAANLSCVGRQEDSTSVSSEIIDL